MRSTNNTKDPIEIFALIRVISQHPTRAARVGPPLWILSGSIRQAKMQLCKTDVLAHERQAITSLLMYSMSRA